MIPGSDISRPLCWMTIVMPTAVIARIAANGNIALMALGVTTPGVTTALTKNSRIVPNHIQENSLKSVAFKLAPQAVFMVWFSIGILMIARPFHDFWKTEQLRQELKIQGDTAAILGSDARRQSLN